MFNEKLSICPACGQPMERGFSHRNQGLSWITADTMKRFIFDDKDLNEAGIKKYVPAPALYNLCYHCPDCKVLIVDYGVSISSAAAKELAASM